jgi:uncharacterized membrane protein
VSGWVHLGSRVFSGLAAILILVLAATLGRLPPVVASHFGAGGAANGWSSRPTYSAFLLGIGILLPLGIVGLVYALTTRGIPLLNVPYKEYWRQAEHAPEAVRRIRAYIWWLGCIIAAVNLATHSFILQAHATEPPRLATLGFGVVYVGSLVAVGFWIVGLYRLLRPTVP